MALVVDTGPVVAFLDRDDTDHQRCVALVESTRESLVLPAPTLVEIDYFARRDLGVGVWRAFVDDVAAGAYRVSQLDADDLVRAAELEAQYADLGLGLVDASVIAVCERLGETKVATLDHRHFSVVRPRHCEALRLLPEPGE